MYVHGDERMIPIADGLTYSVPLLLILVCHELGHYFVARAHGVDASLPYFIPLPPWLGLGTMGAVIGMRDVTSDRKKLIDIGAAGPLAGILVAIPVLLYGLAQSKVTVIAGDGLQEGNSLLYAAAQARHARANGCRRGGATWRCTRRRGPAGRACWSR